jgi:DnaJ-class molecular chaperone
MKLCPECNDSNWAGTIGNGKCKVCHGSGESSLFGIAGTTYKCEACEGTGTCPSCNGEGRVDD